MRQEPGLVAQELGLSAVDFKRLLGVSGASICRWEEGKTRPRDKSMQAIARVRSMGKRVALKALVLNQ